MTSRWNTLQFQHASEQKQKSVVTHSMRDSFVFYRSFIEAIKTADADNFKECVLAICEYALNDKTFEGEGYARMFYELCKPQIDKNNVRYENGRKGGRPKAKENQTETKPKPNENQIETKQNLTETKLQKSKPNVNVNVNDNVNVNILSTYKDNIKNKDNILTKEKEKEKKEKESDKETINATAKLVVDYLNRETGKAFRYSESSLKHIRARLNDGFTLEDCKRVISTKVKEWKNTSMEKYLCPETLFCGKFEKYLNQDEGKNDIPAYMQEQSTYTKPSKHDVDEINELLKGRKMA